MIILLKCRLTCLKHIILLTPKIQLEEFCLLKWPLPTSFFVDFVGASVPIELQKALDVCSISIYNA